MLILIAEEKVKSRWKFLKDRHEQEYMMKRTTGVESSWSLYDHLNFLDTNYDGKGLDEVKNSKKKESSKSQKSHARQMSESEADYESDSQNMISDDDCSLDLAPSEICSVQKYDKKVYFASNNEIEGKNKIFTKDLRSHILKIHPSQFIMYKIECYKIIDLYKNVLTLKEITKDEQTIQNSQKKEQPMASENAGKCIINKY